MKAFIISAILTAGFFLSACGNNKDHNVGDKLADSWSELKASVKKESSEFSAKAQERIDDLKTDFKSAREKSGAWAENEKEAFNSRLKEIEDSLDDSHDELKRAEANKNLQTQEWKEKYYSSLEAIRDRYDDLKEDYKHKL